MGTIEMNKKVKELRELRRMREELDAEITAAEDSIKAEMTARNVDTLAGDDWRITWHKVSSTRFDSVAFKKANPTVYNMFVKSTEGRRFIIA
jgi:predicted phage-related endonuclease